MPDPVQPPDVKVLVTGFGPFLDVTTNPSWEIARNLPKNLASANGSNIQLIVPDAPVPAAYHKLLAQSASLIEQHDPHIVLHMGLAVERDYFAVEQSALKEGYHDIPDIDRKVITRAENKKLFGKAPSSLKTSFDLESVVSMWQTACAHINFPSAGGNAPKSKGGGKTKQEKRKVDIRMSDDVGTYVCGLIYFSSLLEMQKRKRARDVVFLHVCALNGIGEIEVGTAVSRELIVALVDAWEAKA